MLPPKTNKDTERAALLSLLEMKLASFAWHRMFVGMHVNLDRHVFEEAVDGLLMGFGQRREFAIKTEVKAATEFQAPGVENAHIHRWRIDQKEALSTIVADTKAQLMALYDQCHEPLPGNSDGTEPPDSEPPPHEPGVEPRDLG